MSPNSLIPMMEISGLNKESTSPSSAVKLSLQRLRSGSLTQVISCIFLPHANYSNCYGW